MLGATMRRVPRLRGKSGALSRARTEPPRLVTLQQTRRHTASRVGGRLAPARQDAVAAAAPITFSPLLTAPPQLARFFAALPRPVAEALWTTLEMAQSRVPSGFGRTGAKNGAGKAGSSTGASSSKKAGGKKGSSKDGKKKDSGKGGKDGKKGQPEMPGLPTWVLAIGSGLFMLASMRGGAGGGQDGPGGAPFSGSRREWTWQEVRTEFLARGLVEAFEVHNKETVRVVLRAHPDDWFVNRAAAAKAASTDQRRASPSSHSRSSGQSDPMDADPRRYGEEDTRFDTASGDASVDDDPYAAGAASSSGALASGAAPGSKQQIWFRIGSVESFERQLEDAQLDLKVPPDHMVPVKHVERADLSSTISTLMTMALFGLIAFSVLRGMGGAAGGMGGGGGGPGGIGKMFQIGKANVKEFGNAEKTGIKFKDVAGCDEAKAEVMEFVQFLRDPDRFTRLGAKIPKGAILQGPPGTGKTLLAKAVAGEADAPFLSISGSDFIEMFVGVGPSRVRDLFKQAREKAPCIVFIDEIDAVARARSRGGMGSNDERENTLNQLLVEMDGFSTTDGVVVLAGTNRVDILDPAILRPGRFDRQITVDKPDIDGRKQIFKVHLAKLTIKGDIDDYARRLSTLTPGFAGAEIANICNEAAIFAARRGKDAVDLRDFEAAADRVIGGLEKGKSIMTPVERRTVAYHEAGHAVAGWFLEHADPLLKVTIVPRTSGALGFAQYLPKEVALYSKEALIDRMCMALGGRASEELNFGRVTTGASDDLDKVTQMAYAMTTIYGMNPKIGQLSFPPKQEQQFSKPYSDTTANLIDEEARKLVDQAYTRTKALLEEHKETLALLAERLLERETVNQDDLVEVLGERPYLPEGSYKEYLEQKLRDDVEDAEAEKKSQADAKAAAEEEEDDGDSGDSGIQLDALPGLRMQGGSRPAWDRPTGFGYDERA